MSRLWTPRPYQDLALDFVLGHQRCMLAARMGMGKTTTVATALSALQLAGETEPVLVLAPKRVATTTWPDELSKWQHLSHLRASVITGNPRERAAALNRPADLYCMAYDNLPWLYEKLGDRWPFRTVIADESTRLKGFRTRQGSVRAKALGRVAHKHVSRFIALTGTPSPNGIVDLWGQMWFVDAGERLGRTFSAFLDRWFQVIPGGDGYTQIRPLAHAQVEIQERIADICLALDPKDWFDLREPVISPVYVELPAKAREMYRGMEREFYAEIKGRPVEAANAAARTGKLLQMASGAVYTDEAGHWEEIHDAKLQALESVIQEAGQEPVLVAYWFQSDLLRLRKAFPAGRTLDDDPQTVADWNAGRIPVMFIHPASAGHGLNLQDGGRILALFSHDWNLELYEQVIERIGPVRQLQSGHDRNVLIYPIIARDTIDEVVVARRESKADVQQALMDYLKRKTT